MFTFKPISQAILAISISFFILGTVFEAKSANQKTVDKGTLAEISALNVKAANFWQQGKIEEAIALWQRSAIIYREQGSLEEEVNLTLKIANGYTSLGQLELAKFYLEEMLSLVDQKTEIEARIQFLLGNVAQKEGELEEAIAYYQESLATNNNSLPTINNSAIALKKKRIRSQLKAESSREGAETQKYLAEAKSSEKERIAYLKKANLLLTDEQPASSIRTLIEWAETESLNNNQVLQGRKLIGEIPTSRNKIFLILDWAKIDVERGDSWLTIASQEAQNDPFALSFVELEKGLRFFQSRSWNEAIASAEATIAIATITSNYETLYRALWLAASIEKNQGEEVAALNYYRRAIAALTNYLNSQSIFSIEQRLDFTEEIEPLYRETLEILLKETKPTEITLTEVLKISEQLRKAQLQQFFGDNCNILQEEKLTTEFLANKNAVLLTSVVLEQATHLILKLPNGKILYHKSPISKVDLQELGSDWYRGFSEGNFEWQSEIRGAQLYDLIIRPFEQSIEKFNEPTIIFVNDEILRNLPMAALFDGEKFLAQKWASLTSIGLQIIPENSQTIEARRMGDRKKVAMADRELLAFGLGVKIAEWSPLPNVKTEINKIIELMGGEKFLNRQFTSDRFERELTKDYSKLHLATHGYFGGIAENSYVLAYDRPLYASDLDQSLNSKINLLVMSACETAISSDRSVLGLAGLALRNNVNNILGTYWQVEDEIQSQIIEDFYTYLEAGLTFSDALQKVQSEQILLNESPTNWASLNLIGNL